MYVKEERDRKEEEGKREREREILKSDIKK